MMLSIATILAASTAVSAAAVRRTQTFSATPHDSYSSSIGVLGCRINTNRVAYWPMAVDCNNICVRVTHQDRSLTLLRVDQSGGAYDMSYDAWNILGFGESATQQPQVGGGIDMEYEFVDASQCADLMEDGVLPLSASNSMNFVASCLSQPESWVAKHHQLINLLDPICKWGYDEVCDLDLSVSNQPSCPHQLGMPQGDTGLHVTNIAYATGLKTLAV